MKIKWLGHASFLITGERGTRIITDPYTPAGGLKYAPINESADIVTISHEHSDHNNLASVKGNPQAVRGTVSTTIKGIEFKGIPTHHDTTEGKERGSNTVICFTVDGFRVCHLGDLGHALTERQVAEIGEVDVLLSPVAGSYTIDAKEATELIAKLKPKVVIPMHFKNPKCDFPITTVDEFTQGKKNVRVMDTSEVEFKKGAVPENQIIVLKPAL